jgi:hypothetical protein
MSCTLVSKTRVAIRTCVYLVVCAILQRDPHYYGKTEADLAALKLIDLHLLASTSLPCDAIPYVVDLHLPQRTGPAIETKDFVRKRYGLVSLQVRYSTASIARSLRDVFGAELLI